MKPSPGRVLVGVLLLVAGIVVSLVASGTISVDEDAVHAPDWILALLGCVSLLGLAMIVAAAKKSWSKKDG